MTKFEDSIGQDGGAAGGGGGSAVDPLWDSVFGTPLGDDEGAWGGGTFEPVPRCAYLFVVESVEAREVGDEKYPTLHVGIRIGKGPAGTANRVIYDDIFLHPFVRKGEAQEAAVSRLKKQLTRLRNAFQMDQERPMGRSLDAIKFWGQQMVGKPAVTGVIRVEAGRKDEKTGREYDARNRVLWESLARPEAPYAGEEKKYAGMTYGQRTDAEIAAFEAKAAGGGKGGNSAGKAFGAPQPTNFFGGGGQ